MEKFIQYLQQKFAEMGSKLPNDRHAKVAALRQKALDMIAAEGLPSSKDELWRHFPIEKQLPAQFDIKVEADPYQPVDQYFKCSVNDINTDMFTMLNGWYVHKNAPLTTFPNGVIVGSVMAAIEQYPELVLSHLAQFYSDKADKFVRINELFFNDGFFVYVPDQVSVEKPMQFVSIVNSQQKLMINNHNLVILGKHASLSLVQCDDSLHHDQSFINNVSEMILEEGAHLHFYKMENKDAQSMELNHIFVRQKAYSSFFSNAITFNAGILRNMIHVDLAEPFAEAKLYGLYLVDKKQFVDNQVYVNHAVPDCTSYQLYKGIADDESRANFNGHIIVRPQAQRTSAFQTNKNIALTDEARITTKPFLEIYADDVKCSHGATIGQLDEEALFYLKSRGICERNARALLMYAFANEVVNFVEIESLRERLLDMTQKRLSGELSACSHCAFPCGEEKNFSFKIDLSKI
ncbi:MAG: Fe-S cluster assembly protein SufD [Bacteroidales bacterium]|nr:Fe-S cluster assembly protein SufD [Bacteroidales bacterium]